MSIRIVGTPFARIWAGSDRIYRHILKWIYPRLEIHEDAKLITGHFVADQFESLLGNRNVVRGVMVREPLDRMISHYNYWFRDRGGDDWRVLVPFRSGLDFQQYFREFAMLEELQNHQTKALGGLKISQFDVVGVTEHADEFIKAFLERLSQEGFALRLQERRLQKRLNVNVAKQRIKKVDLDEEFIQAFKAHHAQDYVLYRDAVALSHRYMKPSD
jgi:hypothetical protein